MKLYDPDGGETSEDARELPKEFSGKPDRWMVQRITDYCWSRYGWWECSWPKSFVLVDDQGTETHWEVEMAMEPIFSASESDLAKKGLHHA